jgi:uncharacterized protein (DUF952 family)
LRLALPGCQRNNSGRPVQARGNRQTIASFANRRYLRAMLIYKILRRPEWDAFRSAGQTAGAPIDLADGYIHFSTAAQVAETAAKWFATESDLVLVAFESDRLGAALKWEPSRGGQLFPHLYRPLRLDEVVWDKSLPLGATGHIFPEGVW